MKISIEKTEQLLFLDGVQVRVWRGRTETGIECLVFVHRLAVAVEADSSEFARELDELPAPAEVV